MWQKEDELNVVRKGDQHLKTDAMNYHKALWSKTVTYSEERTAEVMSPGQHAAPQVPKGRMSCTPQQAVHEEDVQTAQWHECQRQLRLNMGVHYSLIPWNQIVDEIKNYSHPWPIREGDRCRNPKCDRYANENVEEFWGY